MFVKAHILAYMMYQREEGNVEGQFQLDLKMSKSNLFAKLSRVGEP